MKGVKDQISSFSTKRPSTPASRPTAALNGSERYSSWWTAGAASTTPPSMAQPGPTSRPRRMMVSKEMSAARKLGTAGADPDAESEGNEEERQQGQRSGRGRRCSAKNRRWKVRDARQDAGHGGDHAQLDQQGDQDEPVGHPTTVSRGGGTAQSERATVQHFARVWQGRMVRR